MKLTCNLSPTEITEIVVKELERRGLTVENTVQHMIDGDECNGYFYTGMSFEISIDEAKKIV